MNQEFRNKSPQPRNFILFFSQQLILTLQYIQTLHLVDSLLQTCFVSNLDRKWHITVNLNNTVNLKIFTAFFWHNSRYILYFRVWKLSRRLSQWIFWVWLWRTSLNYSGFDPCCNSTSSNNRFRIFSLWFWVTKSSVDFEYVNYEIGKLILFQELLVMSEC